MGKHLWRKHSFVRVEDDHPGCIWTVFRMLNYHPWHNVRKKLSYHKHKHHENSTKSEGIEAEEEHVHNKAEKLEEESILKNSASVNSTSSINGSTSKRSIKARIRALMKEKNNSTNLDLLIQEPDSEDHKKCNDDDCAPTLMSLLKANPKLIKSIKQVEDSSNIKPEKNHKHKNSKKEEDYVGVLELFRVDQDLFLQILQDSPPRKPRLVKSGTFPSGNRCNFGSKPPSKVEHKHNEVWPVSSNGRELQKAKSLGFVRSSSLTESLDRYGYLFDSNSKKAIKKHLSKSFKLMTEKQYVLVGDLHSQKSPKDRSDFSESESHSYTASEPSRASLERWNNDSHREARGLSVDSPRHIESLVESQSDEKANIIDKKRQSVEEQIDAMAMPSNNDTNDGISSTSVLEFENVDRLITKESSSECYLADTEYLVDQFSTDYCNEDLQYVKYVLDIIGFATVENQREAWHSHNQLIDPALFDGIEICCPFEPKSYNKDVLVHMSSSRRKLLFDFINEALIDIDERLYVYYPKALSYWCHVCPTTKGENRVVEDVWQFVGEFLSWKPELDPTLDLAMDHDLSKNKIGWVNLQMDTEGVGLELEDLIFNELLHEIVCY